ncbi:acyltransferase family protein [Acrocarpospora catenulata]|uniref:acyltransferase family protein n=1 Tax=Acrocarpospora catenulata TaxID=2836182 RepID=UPI001BD9390F|nr:acyltransferase [Acrocarpospora catenulata]
MTSAADRLADGSTTPAGAVPPAAPATRRLVGLDGIRGLAALFVVLHHCRLSAFPGFPRDTGPGWASWLLYGHFAVVVFIVLSGFSLAVAPARRDWELGGLGRFAHRRLWRILPPYWPALAMSLVIAWTLVPQPGAGPPTAASVVFYGLLIQDVFGSPSPNGAFWSIAIEAQLYLVFPLLLMMVRRAGVLVMLGAVGAVVTAIGLLAPAVPAVDLLMRFTPQFALLFAIGAVAAGVAGGRWLRVPWGWLSLVTVVPVLVLITLRGPEWTVANFYWVDLALGPAIGCLLACLAAGRPGWLTRLLDTRPLRALGSFSYSLYLTHAPLVTVLYALVIAPNFTPGVPAFLATLALCVPVTLLVARGFAAVFELPFQRHRTWPELRAAIRARLSGRRSSAGRPSR